MISFHSGMQKLRGLAPNPAGPPWPGSILLAICMPHPDMSYPVGLSAMRIDRNIPKTCLYRSIVTSRYTVWQSPAVLNNAARCRVYVSGHDLRLRHRYATCQSGAGSPHSKLRRRRTAKTVAPRHVKAVPGHRTPYYGNHNRTLENSETEDAAAPRPSFLCGAP